MDDDVRFGVHYMPIDCARFILKPPETVELPQWLPGEHHPDTGCSHIPTEAGGHIRIQTPFGAEYDWLISWSFALCNHHAKPVLIVTEPVETYDPVFA